MSHLGNFNTYYKHTKISIKIEKVRMRINVFYAFIVKINIRQFQQLDFDFSKIKITSKSV